MNNAASTKSGSYRTGSDRIVHFGLRILRDLAFGFRFSSKIQTGFPNFFPVCLRSERQLSASTDLKQPRNAEIQLEQLVLFESDESDVVMVKLSWNGACTYAERNL